MAASSPLPVPQDPGRSLPRAAGTGAAVTALPTLALLACTPFLSATVVPALISSLHALLPFTASFWVSMTLVTLGPAFLALPVAALGAAVARREGAIDRDRGLAAAAGAALATAGLTGTAGLWALATNLQFPMWAPLTAATALAVGVVGGASFLAVPRRPGESRGVPPLYQGLLAAGLGVPSLVVGAGLWTTLTTLVPVLSVLFLQGAFSPSLGLFLHSLLCLTTLAPLTYLLARTARRQFPGLDRGAVGAGLAFPPTLPFLILSAGLLTRLTPSGPLMAMVLGHGLGVLPHLLAIRAGLRAREEAEAPPPRLAEAASEESDPP